MVAGAQTAIDFEGTGDAGYTALGVFDTWEDSPFRTGVLQGNVAVVDNPFKETDPNLGDTNVSDKVLAFQRSRFGSNTFGVRITLANPIALSQTAQYVHVKIHKPKSGRVMLFALGSRADRPWQSKDVVQVEASSLSTVKTDKWYEGVFALTGASGVNVHSLVIAPEVESTHDATEDYAVYIDDIEVNSSSSPTLVYGCYRTVYEKEQACSRTDRYTTGISLKTTDGTQTIAVSQSSNKLVYQDLLSNSFKVKAGESVTSTVSFTGSWMSAYVYLDRDNNGKFLCELNDDGTPTTTSDVMTYSYYKGKNSAGSSVDNGNTLSMPSYTIPSDLTPGFYRMRYKVDWDEIDAAGNSTDANNIVHNGGAYVDTRLNVHTDKVKIYRGTNAAGTNGEVALSDSTTYLNGQEINFGEAYTVKFRPGDGFKLSRFILRHGYNLDGDSLVNETPQYEDVIISATQVSDNTYTIPAKYVDGDVRITPEFVTTDTEIPTETYVLNFPETLPITRSDRYLNSVSFSTTTHSTLETITIANKKLVYQNFVGRSIYAKNSDAVSVNVDYTAPYAAWMHLYLYVDLDCDGAFNIDVNSDGTPATNGEMLSYVYYNGYNSKGATADCDASAQWGSTNSMPSFTIPADLAVGKYRARLKIDWDNADPGGQYSTAEGALNNIDDNGGYVLDFTLDVVDEYPTYKLDVCTTNGSFVGTNNTGLNETVNLGESITVKAQGLDENYVASKVTVRHGKNLDGERVVNGAVQWKEYEATLTSSNTLTVPADSVDGDVRLTANFVNNGSEYVSIFADEFDGEDASLPDSKKWSRCAWGSPVWKRYTAQTPLGQKRTGFVEDGKLVLRCLQNTIDSEKDGSGNKLEMISGALETSSTFSFTYGKVEGRMLTNPHTGNFPAFWMMPLKSTYGGWPYSGEIDIVEFIDDTHKSYHSIHSKWANSTKDGDQCQGQSSNPAKTANVSTTQNQWNVYGFEWTENLMKWYVNGKQVFSYAKSTSDSDLELGQWPFDKPFYLIINQSAGSGAWAKNRDLDYVYETKFDWVRVYQTAAQTGLAEATTSTTLDVYAAPGKIRLVAPKAVDVTVADLTGRLLYKANVQGNKDVNVPTGLYIVNSKKVFVP